MSEEIEVNDEFIGQRIDNYLLREFKKVPKSLIYRVLRKGEIRINKGRKKPDYKLKKGDIIRLPPQLQYANQDKTTTILPNDRVLEKIKQSIIYRDKKLLVINKPSGIAVHGGSGIQWGLIEALRKIEDDEHIELVHRLDRDTSGCLLISRKRSMLRYLQETIRQHKIKKRYLALVMGHWKQSEKIDVPLKKNVVASGERFVRVNTQGKQSISYFSPQQHFTQATLVEVLLKTGRTHQIRVHAQHMEHPIAGDVKYGDDEFNKKMKNKGLNRLFLHAASLSFGCPDTGELLHFESPLDPSLTKLLAQLPKNSS
jgi:23S rRNA pseudouridine955/2504/2580 synthase